MSYQSKGCGDNAPDPLVHCCIREVAQDLSTIAIKDADEKWCLKNDVSLPQEICERLINIWQEIGAENLRDDYIYIFKDTLRTRLKRITIRNSHITDQGLKILLVHNLSDLDISGCNYLTIKSLEYINTYGNDLLSLVINKNILNQFHNSGFDVELNEIIFNCEECQEGSLLFEEKFIMYSMKLQRLILHNFDPRNIQFYYKFLKPLTSLRYLDLSWCTNLGNLIYIKDLQQLSTLILHNVCNIESMVPTICMLKNLRYLDVSNESKSNGKFSNPKYIMEAILFNLPKLSRLDISGTNLANYDYYTGNNKEKSKDDLKDLPPALESRLSNPLEFLGLFNIDGDICNKEVPARIVTGDFNEEQVLTATEMYVERPKILLKALNEVFKIFRYSNCYDKRRALRAVLAAMNKHKKAKDIQMSGSASLYYIAKNEERDFVLNFFDKRRIINTLLDAMDRFLRDSNITQYGCVTICQFNIPLDVRFSYRRLVRVLMRLVSLHLENDNFMLINNNFLLLINSLAQVDGHHRIIMGDLGVMENMLGIIEGCLSVHVHSNVMDVAWSVMWNVTDETPQNCELFLNKGGIDCFQRCLTEFPNRPEALRNMMGLLGNVAEVGFLRPQLINCDLIDTFTTLLDSTSDGIEVSYNAAGVLSHILSDGVSSWTIEQPCRDDVCVFMKLAIESWNIDSKRNINYRSFKPILRLLEIDHTPVCQLWAIWALANLTNVLPEKYCALVRSEGGLALIERLMRLESEVEVVKSIYFLIKYFCAMVISKVNDQKNA